MSGMNGNNTALSGLLALGVKTEDSFPKNRRAELLKGAAEVDTELTRGLENWQLAKPSDPANPMLLQHDPALSAPRGGWGSWGHAVPIISAGNEFVLPLEDAPGAFRGDELPFENTLEHGDSDFRPIKVEWLQGPYRRRFPVGTEGIVVGVTGHGVNEVLALPAGGPLISDSQDGTFSTPMWDVLDGRLDQFKRATIDSALAVVGYPATCFGHQLGYGVGLQFGRAAGQEFETKGVMGYGLALFTARRNAAQPQTGGGPRSAQSFKKSSASVEVAAFLAGDAGGPICSLDPVGSKFTFGFNEEGVRVNSAGLSTDAIFSNNNQAFEGRLNFEFRDHREGRTYPMVSKVHICMDEDESWDWICGKRRGVWKLHTTVPYFDIEPETYYNTTNEIRREGDDDDDDDDGGETTQTTVPIIKRGDKIENKTIQFLFEVAAPSFEIVGDPVKQPRNPPEASSSGPVTGGGSRGADRGGGDQFAEFSGDFGAALGRFSRGRNSKKYPNSAENRNPGKSGGRSSNGDSNDARNAEDSRKEEEAKDKKNEEPKKLTGKERVAAKKAEREARRKEKKDAQDARRAERNDRIKKRKKKQQGFRDGGVWGKLVEDNRREAAERRRAKQKRQGTYGTATNGEVDELVRTEMIELTPKIGHIKGVGKVNTAGTDYEWSREPIIDTNGIVTQRGTVAGIVGFTSPETIGSIGLFEKDCTRSTITYMIHDCNKFGLGLAGGQGDTLVSGTEISVRNDSGLAFETVDTVGDAKSFSATTLNNSVNTQITTRKIQADDIVILDGYVGETRDFVDVTGAIDIGEGAYLDIAPLCCCEC